MYISCVYVKAFVPVLLNLFRNFEALRPTGWALWKPCLQRVGCEGNLRSTLHGQGLALRGRGLSLG